ncbi:unnamed protein product [Echinostoma caproni]|uniref:Reverse transcriptase domain-containing protein n=1 Tax=Echinostoma caproni TaxID=27848 RepID=A0A183AM80_9TREM|nr:unnamed protein product [Echinostoma caproni]
MFCYVVFRIIAHYKQNSGGFTNVNDEIFQPLLVSCAVHLYCGVNDNCTTLRSEECDGIVLLSEEARKLQAFLDSLSTSAAMFGMRFSPSKLTVIVNDNGPGGIQYKFCAELLTRAEFPITQKESKGYHLLNLAKPGYSIPAVLNQSKHWREVDEPTACLVNATHLNSVFYLLNPELLIVDVRDSDPHVYQTDKLMRKDASIIRLSRNSFAYLSEQQQPPPPQPFSLPSLT